MDLFTFLQAIAIFLILEGLFPFLSPSKWREYITSIAAKDDKFIRNTGLLSVLLGIIFLSVLLYIDYSYSADFLMD